MTPQKITQGDRDFAAAISLDLEEDGAPKLTETRPTALMSLHNEAMSRLRAEHQAHVVSLESRLIAKSIESEGRGTKINRLYLALAAISVFAAYVGFRHG